MMFRCDGCGEVALPREKSHRIPTEVRRRAYRDGHSGWEIAREGLFCSKCRVGAEGRFSAMVEHMKEETR